MHRQVSVTELTDVCIEWLSLFVGWMHKEEFDPLLGTKTLSILHDYEMELGLETGIFRTPSVNVSKSKPRRLPAHAKRHNGQDPVPCGPRALPPILLLRNWLPPRRPRIIGVMLPF